MPGHDVLPFQGARLESELYPQVNRGCSDVAAESRSARLREHVQSENALVAQFGSDKAENDGNSQKSRTGQKNGSRHDALLRRCVTRLHGHSDAPHGIIVPRPRTGGRWAENAAYPVSM